MNLKNKILILIIISLVGCNQHKTEVLLNDKEAVAEIPFHFSPLGAIITKCIVNKDTLNFMFDTGAGTSCIEYNIKSSNFVKQKEFKDIHHYKKDVAIYKIDSIKWGDVLIKNLPIAKYKVPIEGVDGIIGADVIKNLIVKIDCRNRKILLSKEPNVISKNGIERDFNPLTFFVNLSEKGSYKEKNFLFDTGFSDEVMVDTILNNTKLVHWKGEKRGMFKEEYSDKMRVNSYFLSELYLDSVLIRNIVFQYDKTIRRNIIGTVFMRRFQSITIDYPNQKIYFEFPEDNKMMKFSGNEINESPISSLSLIYSRLTSLGINFSDNFPHKISELVINDNQTIFDVGDTLMGIDKTVFLKKGFEKELRKNKYYYEGNLEKQQTMLSKTFFQRQKATFHFLKNGKIVSIKAERGKPMKSAPKTGYSFTDKKFGCSAINFSINSLDNFVIHIPYSAVSGEELSGAFYKDGKKQEFTNKPK